MRHFIIGLLLFCSACAFQGHLGPHSANLKGGSNSIGAPVQGQTANLVTKGLAFYDSTGILLAALTNAGRIQTARNEAAKQLVRQGGGTVTYEVEMEAPTPGLWTKFEYTWGEKEGLAYSFGEVRMTIHEWEIAKKQKLVWGIGFYRIGYDIEPAEETAWALPISLGHAYSVTPKLSITSTASLDPLNPLLSLALGNPNWLAFELGVRADFFPIHWLDLFASIQFRQTPADTGETRMRDGYLQLGVMALYNR